MKSQILIPLMAGLALLCACKGNYKYEATDSATIVNDKTKPVNLKTDTSLSGSKLVKTADIRFKVKSVQQTSEKIAALTAGLNGMVTHHTVSSTSEKSADIKRKNDSLLRVTVVNTTADMVVKIPPANMENFMIQVSKMGLYVNNSRMDINDKTLAYLSSKLKLRNEAELAAGQKRNSVNGKDPDNLLAFKNNMVDQQIENRRTDDSVKNSTISLSFYESNIVTKELIANDDLSVYQPSFISQLAMSFQNGWDMFMTVIIFLANVWILIPLLVVGWLVFKFLIKKRNSILVRN